MKPMTVKRGDVNWCDKGYHEITKQAYQGVWFYFGSIGAATCLLDDNLNPVSGKGYHTIDLPKASAKIGAKEFGFSEHLRMGA
jgi:hypothetical protein